MAKIEKIEINEKRLEYLLDLFNTDKQALAEEVKIKPQSITNPITKTVLKKIDRIFSKGLSFYTDPNPIKNKDQSSILFRKRHQNSDLTLYDKRLITRSEDKINYIQGLQSLMGIKSKNKTLHYTQADSPKEVAQKEQDLIPKKSKDDKDFLKQFINNITEKYNVLVLENIETSTKNKSNLCGCFLKKNNAIILNRQSTTFKREIFTLAHELGHFLLNNENMDKNVFNVDNVDDERWCNDFAFYLIVGDKKAIIDSNIDEDTIKNISKEKHISILAIYQHLFLQNKISRDSYNKKCEEAQDIIQAKIQAQKSKQQFVRRPKPIISELQKDIYREAFLKGFVNEARLIQDCQIENIDRFLYE